MEHYTVSKTNFIITILASTIGGMVWLATIVLICSFAHRRSHPASGRRIGKYKLHRAMVNQPDGGSSWVLNVEVKLSVMGHLNLQDVLHLFVDLLGMWASRNMFRRWARRLSADLEGICMALEIPRAASHTKVLPSTNSGTNGQEFNPRELGMSYRNLAEFRGEGEEGENFSVYDVIRDPTLRRLSATSDSRYQGIDQDHQLRLATNEYLNASMGESVCTATLSPATGSVSTSPCEMTRQVWQHVHDSDRIRAVVAAQSCRYKTHRAVEYVNSNLSLTSGSPGEQPCIALPSKRIPLQRRLAVRDSDSADGENVHGCCNEKDDELPHVRAKLIRAGKRKMKRACTYLQGISTPSAEQNEYVCNTGDDIAEEPSNREWDGDALCGNLNSSCSKQLYETPDRRMNSDTSATVFSNNCTLGRSNNECMSAGNTTSNQEEEVSHSEPCNSGTCPRNWKSISQAALSSSIPVQEYGNQEEYKATIFFPAGGSVTMPERRYEVADQFHNIPGNTLLQCIVDGDRRAALRQKHSGMCSLAEEDVEYETPAVLPSKLLCDNEIIAHTYHELAVANLSPVSDSPFNEYATGDTVGDEYDISELLVNARPRVSARHPSASHSQAENVYHLSGSASSVPADSYDIAELLVSRQAVTESVASVCNRHVQMDSQA